MAIAGFIIPFVFVYHPSVLLVLDFNPAAFGWAVFAFGLCTWSLASALTGYDTAPLGASQRILRGVAGLLALVPQVSVALPAALVAAGLLLYPRLTGKRTVS